jgi:small subunit ribosomal protein S8
MTDPIADFLTRIRNGVKARHRIVECPSNGVKKEIARILYEQGFILNYKYEQTEGPQGIIKVALKYDQVTGQSPIHTLQRASRPGLRKYSHSKDLPRVQNGLGVAIISTSKGIMTEKAARELNVGGEILCYVA